MSASPAAAGKAPLDDVMLAMDVVDTLRHRSKMVEQELSQDGRDDALKERLRKIYAAQGIEVPDHVIEEGVTALKEDRFVYEPPRSSLQVRLAHLYINRGSWGKWLGGTLLLCIAICTAYLMLIAWPRAALPGKINTLHKEVLVMSQVQPAKTEAEQLYNSAQAALRVGDQRAAKASLAALTDLRSRLEQTYRLDIVTKPGELSALWRTARNSSTHNYYIIVEATDNTGKPVQVKVRNEESDKQESVSKWAVRVDDRVYHQIRKDKQDDGIIQGKRFGEKRRGYLEPDYNYPTRGATITDW